MDEYTPAPSYKRHRFPPAIIAHAVWLYFRFALSYRDVEELIAERGVLVSYETIRQWCRKFGQQYANGLRRRRPQPGDKWHLDEVFVSINGVQHYLWRAVEQDGNVLDILVQAQRDERAATKFLRKLLKGLTSVLRVVITDKLPATGRPCAECCRAWRIGGTRGSTTARRTRTSRRASRSASRGSAPSSPPSAPIAAHAALSSPTAASPAPQPRRPKDNNIELWDRDDLANVINTLNHPDRPMPIPGIIPRARPRSPSSPPRHRPPITRAQRAGGRSAKVCASTA